MAKDLNLQPPTLDPKDALAIHKNLAKQSDTYKAAIKTEAKKTQPAPVYGAGNEKRPYTGR